MVINAEAPDAVGADVCIGLMGSEGVTPDAKYIGPSCAGIEAHESKIKDVRAAAVQAGAKLLDQSERTQESGEARKLRFQSETATLSSIVRSACVLLERGLKFIALMKGLPTDDISVPVPDALLDSTMTPTDAEALMRVWLEGGISYQTFYENLSRGGIASPERTDLDEFTAITNERGRREGGDDDGQDQTPPEG